MENCSNKNNFYFNRCLVIFFQDLNADACARALIQMATQSEVVLVQTKSYKMDEMSVEGMFGTNRSYVTLVAKGPVIGLEFAGNNSISICQQNLHALLTTKYQNLPHFISQSPADARTQVDKFYNFASMQMFA
ncbi:unnamed protein product [Rotaria socialis]